MYMNIDIYMYIFIHYIEREEKREREECIYACVAVSRKVFRSVAARCSVLHCVALCFSMFQCVAV